MSTNRIINGWHCDVCGRATIVVHVDLGATPMLLRCRATPGCAGVGRSLGYPPFTPPQAVLDIVELEWALPSVTQMKAWKRAHDPMYDHVLAGGLVLRPLTDAGRRVLDTLRPAPEPEPAPAADPDVEMPTPCPARIRPFPGPLVLNCGRGPHLEHGDTAHEAMLRDYAYQGSATTIRWYDEDRRNFTGEWIECPQRGCVLPANHRGDCVS